MNTLLFLTAVTLGFIAAAAGLIQQRVPRQSGRRAAHRRRPRWINREASGRTQALVRLLATAAILGVGAAIAAAAAMALLAWMAEKLAS